MSNKTKRLLLSSAHLSQTKRTEPPQLVSDSAALTQELIFGRHVSSWCNTGCLPADNRDAVCWWWWVVSVYPWPLGNYCCNVTHSQRAQQSESPNTESHSEYWRCFSATETTHPWAQRTVYPIGNNKTGGHDGTKANRPAGSNNGPVRNSELQILWFNAGFWGLFLQLFLCVQTLYFQVI